MQTSFCTIAFQENKWGADREVERPLVDLLPIVAGASYDGVEIWGPHVESLGAAELDEVAEALERTGLAVAMIDPYFNFTTSDDSCRASVDHGKRMIELARRLGAGGVRCFTGKTASADAGDAEWGRAVGALRELADASEDLGLLWGLETHSWNLMDTIETSRELVDRVGRDRVRLILQPATFKERYMEATRELAPLACHVHATNSRGGEKCGLAKGDMDWRAILAELRKASFTGFISVEWMGAEPEAAAGREAAYLSDLIAEVRG